jgi:hypothetical protein
VAAILQNSLIAAIAGGLLIVMLAWRTFRTWSITKSYGEQFALWRLPLLDLGIAWHYVTYWLRYRCADKKDFERT